MHDLFASHQLSPDAQKLVEAVRSIFDTTLAGLQPILTGSGRYDALVKTKLEEACMFAIKGISTQPANWARNMPEGNPGNKP